MKEYNPAEMEPRIRKFWEDQHVFRFQKDSRPIYSIDTPPRTLSGTIHMGHAMSYSQMEFIARYKRMRGYNVFFPMGFDDNGLATERYVEKKYKVNAKEMKRDDFINLCLKETVIGGEYFRKVWTTLGISCDWTTLYSTIDEHCRRVAQKSFIHLYRMGHLERKEDAVTWCPLCETAIAQAELEDKTEETFLTTISFTCGRDSLPIATTRPEFLAACVAVVVHPEDTRYRTLPGKKAKVPLSGQEVPIIADNKVDMSFGTGIVMVCTFGDKTDVEWWRDFNLDTRIIIEKNGTLNALAGPYQGMSLTEARSHVLKDLKEKNLIVTQEKMEHTLNAHERCHTPVEFIIAKQWFVKVLNLKDELIKRGKEINWFPDYMGKRYESWVENLRWDWCISRQRHYGIPFPVWYCKGCGKLILADENNLPVDPVNDKPPPCECGSTEYEPERDVLDTWFTSAHTPQIAARWGESDSIMDSVFPMSVRCQAHDIIRTWAFYTIVKALLHHNTIPWYDAMISGHGLDEKGKAMHASKGNVVLPMDMVEKYSADAVRWWASETKLGEDLFFKEKDVEKGYKLCVKLWNASKLVSSHLRSKPEKTELREIDKWLFNRLNAVIAEATRHLDIYEYGGAKSIIETSFWHDFCDNYLEAVKYRLYGEKDDAASYTVYYGLLTYLKLFSPCMAHVTEEIYQTIYTAWEKDKSIHLSLWPQPFDVPETASGQKIVDIISVLRRWKSDTGRPLNCPLTRVRLYTREDFDVSDIKGAMNIKEIEITKENPHWREKISRVSLNFKVIGPLFGKDTKRVASLLEKYAETLEKGEEIEVEGFILKREYISSLQKEFYLGEKKVDILSSGDITIEVEE